MKRREPPGLGSIDSVAKFRIRVLLPQPCRSCQTIRSEGVSTPRMSSSCPCVGIYGIPYPTSMWQSYSPNEGSPWTAVVCGAGCKLTLLEINKRCRPHLKPTNKSYRVDETYIKVRGQEKYLYRAVDSTGQTIDFLLTAKRDAAAAKRFFRKALSSPGNPVPPVINVDKTRHSRRPWKRLKMEGILPRRVRLRQCKYLNNILEQDHRTVKKRTWLAKGYGSFASAWRTLQGIEAVEMIRKGRVRWIPKGDSIARGVHRRTLRH